MGYHAGIKIILLLEFRNQAPEQSRPLTWGILLKFAEPVCSFLNEDRDMCIVCPPYKLLTSNEG